MMAYMSDGSQPKVLVRSLKGRVVAGVCAGVADYFGVDVILVRVIWAIISVFTAGAGVLAYLLAWVIIPEEGEKVSIVENIINKNKTG